MNLQESILIGYPAIVAICVFAVTLLFRAPRGSEWYDKRWSGLEGLVAFVGVATGPYVWMMSFRYDWSETAWGVVQWFTAGIVLPCLVGALAIRALKRRLRDR